MKQVVHARNKAALITKHFKVNVLYKDPGKNNELQNYDLFKAELLIDEQICYKVC